MRTTLDLNGDVLQAAREIARREKRTVGVVLSTSIAVEFRCAGPCVHQAGHDSVMIASDVLASDA